MSEPVCDHQGCNKKATTVYGEIGSIRYCDYHHEHHLITDKYRAEHRLMVDRYEVELKELITRHEV